MRNRIAALLAPLAILLLVGPLTGCRSRERREPYQTEARPKRERSIGAVLASLENHIVAWNAGKLEAPTPENLARLRAIETVIRTEARAQVEAMLQQLRGGPPRNRRVAAAALGFAQDPRAIEPLLAAASEEDGEVASNALIGLGVLATPGGPRTPALLPPLPPLLRVLLEAKEGTRRTNAAFAVKRAVEAGARATEALGSLLEALRDPEGGVRSQSAAALGALGDPAAADALLERTEDPDPVVRASAAFALGNLRIERARETLEKLRVAPEPGVREAARAALLSLKGEPSVPSPR